MKHKPDRCQECGHDEFCSQPNQYDIYHAENGRIVFSESTSVDDDGRIYCRECEAPYKGPAEIVM